MTAKDLKLIEEANRLSYSGWMEIDENAADTKEAKEILHDRMCFLYHLEEYYCGLA